MKRLVLGCLFIAIAFGGIKAYSQRQTGEEQFKHDFLERINHVRATGCTCGTTYMPPVAPLAWNNNLQTSAGGHAWDMSNNRYFSHTSKNGRTMEDRIVKAGYYFNGYKNFIIGENIAYGQQSIDEVMAGWLKSEGHCKNLMNPGFKEVGVAENHHYWVQDFGGRESFSPLQQQLIKEGKMTVVQDGMHTKNHE
jgi:uncharacterized protein YkwD